MPATILGIGDIAGDTTLKNPCSCILEGDKHSINKMNTYNKLCLFSNLGDCRKRLVNKGETMEIKLICNTQGGGIDNMCSMPDHILY